MAKQLESMYPSCVVSMVQANDSGVAGDKLLVNFGSLVPIEHCLNTTVYLGIVADHVHPLVYDSHR